MNPHAERPAWQDNANCKNQGNEHFYLGVGESSGPARRLCTNCTVRAECLEYGLHDPHGIWGGMTPREREALRAARGITRTSSTWTTRQPAGHPGPTPGLPTGSVPADILDNLGDGDLPWFIDPFEDTTKDQQWSKWRSEA